jgi:hypothetical protein
MEKLQGGYGRTGKRIKKHRQVTYDEIILKKN